MPVATEPPAQFACANQLIEMVPVPPLACEVSVVDCGISIMVFVAVGTLALMAPLTVMLLLALQITFFVEAESTLLKL